MPNKTTMVGNDAMAEAMRQINPEVVAAYPITPSSHVMEKFANFVADGKVDTEFIPVESEHSAMSACMGASAAGGRVMTASGSQGLALMHEVLYAVAGARLPIVLVNGNRTLSAPLNIHCDHSDSMGARDSGWIQLYSETVQESYDNLIQAILIAENDKVRNPIMVCFDAFETTHTLSNIQIEDDDKVREFIGEYVQKNPLLDIENPITSGGWDRPDYLFEHKRSQIEGLIHTPQVVKEVGEKFEKMFGRKYDTVEGYRLEDAEYIAIAMSSSCGTIKETIDDLREKDIKAGLLKIRLFRPFPVTDIVKYLKGKKGIAVFDRTISLGLQQGAPLFNEIRSALYDLPENEKPKILDFIYGLGGRDIYPENIEKAFLDIEKFSNGEKIDTVQFLNLRSN